MIWELDSPTIVMVTNLKEEDKVWYHLFVFCCCFFLLFFVVIFVVVFIVLYLRAIHIFMLSCFFSLLVCW